MTSGSRRPSPTPVLDLQLSARIRTGVPPPALTVITVSLTVLRPHCSLPARRRLPPSTGATLRRAEAENTETPPCGLRRARACGTGAAGSAGQPQRRSSVQRADRNPKRGHPRLRRTPRPLARREIGDFYRRVYHSPGKVPGSTPDMSFSLVGSRPRPSPPAHPEPATTSTASTRQHHQHHQHHQHPQPLPPAHRPRFPPHSPWGVCLPRGVGRGFRKVRPKLFRGGEACKDATRNARATRLGVRAYRPIGGRLRVFSARFSYNSRAVFRLWHEWHRLSRLSRSRNFSQSPLWSTMWSTSVALTRRPRRAHSRQNGSRSSCVGRRSRRHSSVAYIQRHDFDSSLRRSPRG